MSLQRKPTRRRRSIGEHLKGWLRRVFRPESPLPISAALLGALIVLGVLAGLYVAFPGLRPDYWRGVYVEVTGFLFDLLFFGVALALLVRWQDRKQSIARYQDEVQDFKRWSTEEGRLRIAGAVRRLVRMGKTDIDFTGMKLRRFSFKANDIKSIRGSRFYEGEWGTASSREQVDLKDVDFSIVDCSDVLFSRFNPFEGLGFAPPVRIANCSFCDSNLRGAVFNGAALEWSEAPPLTIHEEVENPDGSLSLVQSVYPPFDGADLAGTSFKNSRFKNADFREAKNVLEADFSGATGLETCVFDDDLVSAEVLRQATQRTS